MLIGTVLGTGYTLDCLWLRTFRCEHQRQVDSNRFLALSVWCVRMNPSEVPPEILNLSVTARLELVGKIWDSIAEDGFPPLTQKQRDLLDERILEADSNPQNRIPASVVFQNARRLH